MSGNAMDPRDCFDWVSRTARQLASFAAIGGIGVGLNFTLYIVFMRIGLHYIAASTLAWFLSFCVIFLLNRWLTFRSGNPWLSELLRTLAVYAAQQAVVLLGLYLAVAGAKLDPRMAFWFVLPPAVLVSFLGLKFFAMRQKHSP